MKGQQYKKISALYGFLGSSSVQAYLFVVVVIAAAAAEELCPPWLAHIVSLIASLGMLRYLHLPRMVFSDLPPNAHNPVIPFRNAELAEL